MCTILVRLDPTAGEPVVVAANRDEFLDRPADDPLEIAPGVFAGRDVRAGGTWLAVSANGIAALTNVRDRPLDARAPSRGDLPLAALGGRLPADLSAWNPFNLLIVDRTGARVLTHLGPGEPTITHHLAPGTHAIANDPFGSPSPRAAHAARLAAIDGLDFATLAQHGTSPDDGLCHHWEGYGTRSATIIALDRAGAIARYWHRATAPCRAVTSDLTLAARAVVSGAR